jgi:hypothetical protein
MADRTHSFTASAVWNLDFVDENASLIKRVLADGWTLSTIVTLQTGQPLTITAGQDRNLDGVTTDRADLVGDPVLSSNRSRDERIEEWFSRAAFALPALGTDGSAGRSIVEGPSYRNVDFGLFRDIRVAGRSQIQLRLEATNLFNIVNLSNPETNLNATATFGKIRTARDMRRIQLGARFSF